MKRNKQGVSLIVLVITIIVMIILASAVMISLSNNGIIGKAQEAVDANDLKQVQNIAALAWSDAYLDKMSGEQLTDQDILFRINEALTKNGVTPSKYDIELTENGVDVYKLGTHWKLIKTVENGVVTSAKVTNKVDTLDVGTTVNYMPDGVGDENYTDGWKILGVDSNGRLLLLANTGPKVELFDGGTFELAVESYRNAITNLNAAVSSYKDGKIGIEVRSVNADDINAITGFDKTKYKGYGEISEYGKKVTYSWDEDVDDYDVPLYRYGDMTEPDKNVDSIGHWYDGSFYYLDDEYTLKESKHEDNAGKEIATITNTYYNYVLNRYISESTLAYKMINGSALDDKLGYWLASRFVETREIHAIFGILYIYTSLDMENYFMSDGDFINQSSGYVRAVVTLDENVKLTESKSVSGTYDLSLAD